jgi:hypothetical protein
MKTEIYTYTRVEIENNKVIMAEQTKNEITYKTENSACNIYLPNSLIKAGVISFINNLVLKNVDSLNTAIITLVTKNGSLTFNLNYVLKFQDSKPEVNKVFVTKPTFVSGDYLNYDNIKVSIFIVDLLGDRIITIEYN